MSTTNKIGLLGAGGQARELAAYISASGYARVEFAVVNKEYAIAANEHFKNVVVLGEAESITSSIPVLVAVGPPALKRSMVAAWSGEAYARYIDPSAKVVESAKISKGCVIAPGVVITSDTSLAPHVLVNVLTSISHDTIIGEFVTISPNVSIGGNVTIGEGVFIGIGATIMNGVNIAAGCVIGAGAVVIEDIKEENTVVAGVPAKPVKKNEGWLEKI